MTFSKLIWSNFTGSSSQFCLTLCTATISGYCFTGLFLYSYLFGTCILEKRKYFWKNHGKFMEFDFGIRLETLYDSQGRWKAISWTVSSHRSNNSSINIREIMDLVAFVCLFVGISALSCLNRSAYDLEFWHGGRP